MHSFEVHSNESACRKSGRLGMDQVNKDKHGKNCHNQQKHIPPFVLSIDGMVWREDLVALAQLSQNMAEKMNETILHIWG